MVTRALPCVRWLEVEVMATTDVANICHSHARACTRKESALVWCLRAVSCNYLFWFAHAHARTCMHAHARA